MLWHLRRVPWRWHVIPMVYDELLRDWRVQWRRLGPNRLVELAIEATSVEAARAFVPAGNVFREAQLVESCGAALPYNVGDVVEEWWGEPLPRAALPAMEGAS